MSDLAERVLSRVIKIASWDGPFLWVEDNMMIVWCLLDSYGRAHHVAKDLREAEERLFKVKDKFWGAFIEHGVRSKNSEITIDGYKKGRGRNPMVMSFYISWDNNPENNERAQKALSDGNWGIKSIRKMAKAKTFPEAKAEIWEYLKSKRWKLSDPNLKVSHATAPDTDIRVWFKKQAVYYTVGTRHNFKDARSLHLDIRRLTPEQFVKQVEKWAEDED